MNKQLLIIASITLMLSVALGAFGAHGLKNMVGDYQISIWNKGVFYQFIHGIGIFLICILRQLGNIKSFLSGWLFLAGIIMFSGSLYLLALKPLLGTLPRLVGIATPIGGVFFIMGWLALSVDLVKTE